MPKTAKGAKPRRPVTVERIAPALAVMVRGGYAREAAEVAQVSVATILNWIDWAWKHRDEVDAHLRGRYPDLSQEQLASLWERIQRRRVMRERRANFSDWRKPLV